MIWNLIKLKINLKQLLLFFVVTTVLILLLTNTAYAQEGDDGGVIGDFFLRVIYTIATTVPAVLVWVTGLLLNFSIDYFVVNMGSLINNETGVGFAINGLWQIIRDTMNIIIIFGLIFIGLKTILNSEDSGTRKALIQLIGAALLINFSLFIAKLIIDFSNTIAVQLYNLTLRMGEVNANLDLDNIRYSGISGAFMDLLGVLSLSGTKEIIDSGLGLVEGIVFSVMAMIFLLITAVVFAAGAFMLIARFVALIFYMVFSPIMFLGWILPQFKSYSSNWWSGFFQRAFFAPAYLFLIFLSYTALSRFSINGLENGPQSRDISFAISSGGSAEIIFYFAFAIGMLIGSVIVAQKMSISGAGTTLNVLQNARKGAQSFAARNTIGRTSRGLGKAYDKFQAGDTGKSKAARFSRGLVNAATLGATSDKSIRSAFAYGSKQGFGGQSREDEVKEEKDRKAKLAVQGNKARLSQSIKNAGGKSADSEERTEMERKIADATNDQLEELGADTLSEEMVAGSLSQSQFESLLKSDKLNETQKGKIADARHSYVKDKLHEKNDEGANLEGGRVKVEDASAGQLSSLGGKFLSEPENAVWLGEKQMDEIEKKMTESESGRIKKARKEALISVANGTSVGKMTLNDILRKKPGDIAKLPKEVLTHKNVVTQIPTNALAKMLTDGTQNKDTQKRIRDAIMEGGDEYEVVEGYGVTNPDKRIASSPQAKWLESNIGQQFGT